MRGWHAFQEGLRRPFMRVCMGRHGIEKDIHDGLHGFAWAGMHSRRD